MTITIDLTPEQEEYLTSIATDTGLTIEAVVLVIIDVALDIPNENQVKVESARRRWFAGRADKSDSTAG